MIFMVDIEELNCNLKSVEYRDIKILCESIKKLWILDPLRVDGGNNIIDGRNRYWAAFHLGVERVPVLFTGRSLKEWFIAGIYNGLRKYKI